jgi:hypothetical protein
VPIDSGRKLPVEEVVARVGDIAATEFLLNLHRDLVQPLLGSIRPILVTPDLYLKLSYPIFGRSKLTDSLRLVSAAC